jgi:Putative zinc-finger
MIPFHRSCKDVAALVIAREDRALPLADRIALRLHMGICAACPKFEHQVLVMRKALRKWRDGPPDGDTGPAAS